MARKLTFCGHSDDLFEIDGTRGDEPDEIGCYDRPVSIRITHSASETGLHVTGHYAVAGVGCWMIGLSQLDEDIPLPTWPMEWSTEGYTVRLTLTIPDDAEVTLVEV